MLLPILAAACASGGPVAGQVVLRGATLPDGTVRDVELRDGSIAAIGDVDPTARVIDVTGRWLVPAAIDSHVHLTYLPKVAEHAAGGIAAAVDLAAPIQTLATPPTELTLIASGPMVTAVGGYPTRSWGAGGYGREVEKNAPDAVDELVDAGAGVIKIALNGDPQLTEPELTAAVSRAHARDRKVVVHALSDAGAALGARIGADALAHTPVEPLTDATVKAWAGRAVISTLSAFGGSPGAVRNLTRLRDAGCTVLYGTDFGNSRTTGIDAAELRLLEEAGLTPAEIGASMTSVPAAWWSLSQLGEIAVGEEASLLVLPVDPAKEANAWSRAEQVWIAGSRRR